MSDPVARLTAAQVMRRERVVELQWMASIRLGAVLAALCIFGGCGSDGVETATTPVAWQLDDAPILSIGEQDSGFAGDLYGIRGVARLESGRIIVADRAQRLVVFDADGAYLTTHGREGEGPGEFRSIAWILRLPGDSLLIYDGGLRRTSILTPDGELADAAMDAPPPNLAGRPTLLGRFADGTLLSQSVLNGPAGGGGVVRPDLVLLRHSWQWNLIDTLMTIPGPEVFIGGLQGPNFGGFFLRETRIVVGAQEVYVATGDRFEVTIIHLDQGMASRIIERSIEPVLVTDEDIRAQLPGVTVSDVADRLPVGQTLPLTRRLLLDDGNNLWVEEYRRDQDSPGTWSVFDPEGQLLAEVIMPPRFRPYDIGPDFVLGVIRDRLDVERIHLYGLGKP